MENSQTLDEQIQQQKHAEAEAKLPLFLQEFDELQRKHGLVLVPCINQGRFGELVPSFRYVAQEDFEKITGQKLTPTTQGESN